MAEVMAPVARTRPLAIKAAIVAAIGFVVLVLGLVVNPERAMLSYLMAFAFAFTIAVGGLIFLSIAYVTKARWMAVVRRASELVTLPLPALAVLFVPIALGMAWLYPWRTPPAHLAHHELEILAHRAGYFAPLAFVLRAVVYFTILILVAELLRRWSRRRDANDPPSRDLDTLSRDGRFAAAMLPPVGIAFTFAIIDWVMSLQPVWYSSMFPVNAFAGGFLAAIAIVTIVTERLYRHRDGSPLTPHHFHALGRMLFAFTVFWTYTAFFQALLIRIADKPEEVAFYIQRTTGIWEAFVWILILGHFALPFLFLLTRPIKFRPRAMAAAGAWLLAMHLVDVYWNVIPSHGASGFVFHWLDLAALAAVGGACIAVTAWRQHGRPLVAIGDPLLLEGAAYRSPL